MGCNAQTLRMVDRHRLFLSLPDDIDFIYSVGIILQIFDVTRFFFKFVDLTHICFIIYHNCVVFLIVAE